MQLPSSSARLKGCWTSPDAALAVVNSAAAINSDFERVGNGIVARDDNDAALLSCARSLLNEWTAEMGESAAAVRAMEVAKKQGRQKVIFKGDAGNIV